MGTPALPANFPTNVDLGTTPQAKIAQLIEQYNAGNPAALDTAQMYGIKTSDIVSYLNQHPEIPNSSKIRGDMMEELKVQAQYGNADAKQFLASEAAQAPTATSAPPAAPTPPTPPPPAPSGAVNLAAPSPGISLQRQGASRSAPVDLGTSFAAPGDTAAPGGPSDATVNLASAQSSTGQGGGTFKKQDANYNPPYLGGPYGGPQPPAPAGPPDTGGGGGGGGGITFGGTGVGSPGITQGPIIPPAAGGPSLQNQTDKSTTSQASTGTTSGTTAAQGTTTAAGAETTAGTGSRTLTPEEKAALTATLGRLGITGQQADDLVTQATQTSMKALNDLIANPGYTDAEKAAIQVSPEERAAAINLAEAPVTGAANAARDRMFQMDAARGGGTSGFNATIEEIARQEGRDASDAALKAGLSEDQAQRAANEAIAAARQQGSQFAGSLAQGQQSTQQNRQTAQNDAITRLLTGAPEVNTSTAGQKDTSSTGTTATTGTTTGTTNQTTTGTGTDTSTRSTVPITPVVTGAGSGIIGGQTVPNPGTVTYPVPGSTGTGAGVKLPNITSSAPGTGGIPGLNVDMHTAPVAPLAPAQDQFNLASPTLSSTPTAPSSTSGTGSGSFSGTPSALSTAPVNLAATPQAPGGPTNLFSTPKNKKPFSAAA